MLRETTTTSTFCPKRGVIGQPRWGGTAPVTSCLLSICLADCRLRTNLSLLLSFRPQGPGTKRGTHLVSSATHHSLWLVRPRGYQSCSPHEEMWTHELSPLFTQSSWDLGTQDPGSRLTLPPMCVFRPILTILPGAF